MENYKLEPLKNNVDEMFIGPFGSSLKNDCFVDEDEAFCMVYEQKHAIQKTMDVDTRYVNEKKYNELKRFNVHGGDIIVSCRGTIGETYIVPDDAPLGIMHPSIMKIRLKEGVYDKRYFNDLLYTRLKKHEAEANGSGVKMAISANKLGEELFPVPSIQQQKEIERKLKLVRKLIDQREEELSALDELIKARFVEMFGDPVSTSNEQKADLEEICEKITDGEHGSVTRISEGHPFLNAKHILKNGQIDWNTITFIGDDDHKRIYKRCNPEEGDILLTTTGTIGNVAIMPVYEEVSMDRGITLLKIDHKKVTSEFVAELLKQPSVQAEMGVNVHASAIGHLFMNKVKKLPAIIPSMDKQIEFTDFVKQVDKSKVAVQKSLEETQTLFDSLMQEYFG